MDLFGSCTKLSEMNQEYRFFISKPQAIRVPTPLGKTCLTWKLRETKSGGVTWSFPRVCHTAFFVFNQYWRPVTWKQNSLKFSVLFIHVSAPTNSSFNCVILP